jgi:small subunit ribosomal protein S1
MNYGVFIRLEDGIEGLVHISEMSWTRRLAHPGEIVSLGDEIEVIVLNVNKEKQEISLGIKQTQTNPWAIASQKYPPGTIVTTKVRSLTNFGAFVEIEPGVDGMIHISDLSWTRKHSHPGEALQKGQEVKCVVLEVNVEKRRVSLGIKQMTEDPWLRAIPEKYIPGHIIKGKVAKLTNFGAFVELEPDLEGLLHISELADHKIDKPQDIVKVGDEVEVKILKVDTDSRKIGLSLRRVQWAAEEEAAAAEADKQREPSGPERVLSDADMSRFVKPKGKTDRESKDDTQTDSGAKVDAQADDKGSDTVSKASDNIISDSQAEQLVKSQDKNDEQTERVNPEAGVEDKNEGQSAGNQDNSDSKAKGSRSSILSVFKRKKKEPSDSNSKAGESEQSEDTEAASQASSDGGPEQKTGEV